MVCFILSRGSLRLARRHQLQCRAGLGGVTHSSTRNHEPLSSEQLVSGMSGSQTPGKGAEMGHLTGAMHDGIGRGAAIRLGSDLVQEGRERHKGGDWRRLGPWFPTGALLPLVEDFGDFPETFLIVRQGVRVAYCT